MKRKPEKQYIVQFILSLSFNGFYAKRERKAVLANLDANQIKASALQTPSKQRNVFAPPIEE
jgi:hypothetical protein